METKKDKIDRMMSMMNKPGAQERVVIILSESIIGSDEPPRVTDVISFIGPPLTREEKRPYFTDEEWADYLERKENSIFKERLTHAQMTEVLSHLPADAPDSLHGLTPSQMAEYLSDDPA